jgi:hypothetical protein
MMRAWKPNKRITFDFLECPICLTELKLPGNSLAGNLYKQHLALRKKILLLSLKRIRTEKMDKCKALTDPKSPFKGKMQ